jgi:hypothetical protein
MRQNQGPACFGHTSSPKAQSQPLTLAYLCTSVCYTADTLQSELVSRVPWLLMFSPRHVHTQSVRIPSLKYPELHCTTSPTSLRTWHDVASVIRQQTFSPSPSHIETQFSNSVPTQPKSNHNEAKHVIAEAYILHCMDLPMLLTKLLACFRSTSSALLSLHTTMIISYDDGYRCVKQAAHARSVSPNHRGASERPAEFQFLTITKCSYSR